MASPLTRTPLDAEPLPVYSRHDPDSMSTRSAAPSYAEPPPYTSYRTPTSLLPPLLPHEQVSSGLPAPRYAPGFQSRGATGNVSDINMSHYNVRNWSNTRSNNAKQYNAVARRRANMARERSQTESLLNSLSAVPPPSSPERPGSRASLLASSSSSATPNAYPVQVGTSSEPLNPREDPSLVGEEAAERARAQRVDREMCLKGEEAAEHESRSWDFMVGQMADWEERDKSWRGFRRGVGGTSKRRYLR